MLTPEEKEREKQWNEDESGCKGWQDGWLMYDRTPVYLFQQPGLNGDAYWCRKCTYGLNLQVFYHSFFLNAF